MDGPDVFIEEEDSPYVETENPSAPFTLVNPVPYILEFLATYGWLLLGTGILAIYCIRWLLKRIDIIKQQQWDAEYHKDPDKALARMEAVQRAREKQQQLLQEASRRAEEQQKEMKERKRAELLERLEKYGTAAGGRVLGTQDDDYMPLSAGASTSSYRPQKRSKCGGCGCGR